MEVPRYNADKLRAMAKFTEAREAAYAHMAQALRSGDPAEANAALRENADALRIYNEAINALVHWQQLGALPPTAAGATHERLNRLAPKGARSVSIRG